jgi:sRNA-binding protein
MSRKWREIYRGVRAQVPLIEARFIRKYPSAFFPKDSTETEPLAIGVAKNLAQDNPDVPWLVVVEVLKRYTAKDRYQRALATRPHRVNLDGSIFGEVTPQHRERAIEVLSKRQELRIVREAACWRGSEP